MKITVLEACDGFSIILDDSPDVYRHFWFSQEDSIANLTKVFELLGFKAEYEEDY